MENIPIDDILECARYGELEDISEYVKETQLARGLPVPSSDARVDLLSMKGRTGNTMLHMASANGHLGNILMPYPVISELVKYLLEMSPLPLTDRVNAMNDEGNTPLHWAALNGYAEIAELLIRTGANGKLKNSGDHTPLYYAQFLGHDAVVDVMLQLVPYESDAEDDDDEEDSDDNRYRPEMLKGGEEEFGGR